MFIYLCLFIAISLQGDAGFRGPPGPPGPSLGVDGSTTLFVPGRPVLPHFIINKIIFCTFQLNPSFAVSLSLFCVFFFSVGRQRTHRR